MIVTDITKNEQCQICYSLIYAYDERCIVHYDDGDRLSCILCGAAAEQLGWCISV